MRITAMKVFQRLADLAHGQTVLSRQLSEQERRRQRQNGVRQEQIDFLYRQLSGLQQEAESDCRAYGEALEIDRLRYERLAEVNRQHEADVERLHEAHVEQQEKLRPLIEDAHEKIDDLEAEHEVATA